jgi:hypothetical protein
VRDRIASLPTLRLVLSALVVATSVRPHAGVQALPGSALPSSTHLSLPGGYVLLSPLSRLLDALTFLSTVQDVALLLTLLSGVALWAALAARGTLRPRWAVLRYGVSASAACVAAFLSLIVAAALLPRPAAELDVHDPDLVRVDFHTHTAASHDVPRWFDASRRREWERAVGYDLAFVSDHRSFDGAAAALAANPRRAGDDVVLAPALEAWFRDKHVVLLGVSPADRALLADPHLDDVLPAAVRDGRLVGGSSGRPVAISVIPDDVRPLMTPAMRDGAPFVRALEVADGAPRALDQADRERDTLSAFAARLDLVPVAGSNHHGWGRAAAAWTLVRVPAWRALPPDTLAARVVDVLRRRDRAAVRVVERERPVASGAGLARVGRLTLTAPALVWETLRALTPAERVTWLLWTWGLVAVRLAVYSRQPRAAEPRALLVR